MPDMRTSRTFHQLPLITEQQVKITIIPLCWIGCPGTLDTTGDGVAAFARAIAAEPAKTHIFDIRTFWFGTNQRRITSAMSLAKGMATSHQRHGFFVIHRHPGKCFTHIMRTGQWIWIAIRAFRVHIDQAHLHSRQRMLQITLT